MMTWKHLKRTFVEIFGISEEVDLEEEEEVLAAIDKVCSDDSLEFIGLNL